MSEFASKRGNRLLFWLKQNKNWNSKRFSLLRAGPLTTIHWFSGPQKQKKKKRGSSSTLIRCRSAVLPLNTPLIIWSLLWFAWFDGQSDTLIYCKPHLSAAAKDMNVSKASDWSFDRSDRKQLAEFKTRRSQIFPKRFFQIFFVLLYYLQTLPFCSPWSINDL